MQIHITCWGKLLFGMYSKSYCILNFQYPLISCRKAGHFLLQFEVLYKHCKLNCIYSVDYTYMNVHLQQKNTITISELPHNVYNKIIRVLLDGEMIVSTFDSIKSVKYSQEKLLLLLVDVETHLKYSNYQSKINLFQSWKSFYMYVQG